MFASTKLQIEGIFLGCAPEKNQMHTDTEFIEEEKSLGFLLANGFCGAWLSKLTQVQRMVKTLTKSLRDKEKDFTIAVRSPLLPNYTLGHMQ